MEAAANVKAVFESINPRRKYPITPLENPNVSTKMAMPTASAGD
jgi:hypothetical protein